MNYNSHAEYNELKNRDANTWEPDGLIVGKEIFNQFHNLNEQQNKEEQSKLFNVNHNSYNPQNFRDEPQWVTPVCLLVYHVSGVLQNIVAEKWID